MLQALVGVRVFLFIYFLSLRGSPRINDLIYFLLQYMNVYT